MFDELLKGKFYSKCKSVIKLTKTRIDMIKRKRNAMEKFLRKDIVDLLTTGLDVNVYGKTELVVLDATFSSKEYWAVISLVLVNRDGGAAVI
ncbi:hypothetical protein LOK49_LG01G01330 [Camellia lanceoleosa]|uniref:Uncharacterized protein n=1 Tax=Camellia lanceoleosa TaxID=1840588 RepID=A0ACC0IUD2_9ERIC|nr:hypothetical protein LOK49_LG01G01330 [Camellia lanceoleosa]